MALVFRMNQIFLFNKQYSQSCGLEFVLSYVSSQYCSAKIKNELLEKVWVSFMNMVNFIQLITLQVS